MPVASWIAVALATCLPAAVLAERAMGGRGRIAGAGLTALAIGAGLLGIAA